MKKYKSIIFAVSLLYLGLAVLLAAGFYGRKAEKSNAYRVEINRIAAELQQELVETGSIAQQTALSAEEKNSGILAVEFLQEDAKEEQIVDFYEAKNDARMEIVPLLRGQELVGYLRFDYRNDVDVTRYFWLTEGMLFFLFAVMEAVLLYTLEHIVKPFTALSEMPYELSKGNLTTELKESKNRYFGKFIWGIGMLKDTLEVHKNQELKLAKEKKMMILTISHDIKTPLNAIKLYAKALEEGIYTSQEEVIMAAKGISDKTDEINQFVQEIIKSSTEEIVAIDVNIQAFYLEELVAKIVAGFSEKCRRRKLSFVIAQHENYLVKGDMDRFYEAIGNLIENALKYGDGGKINICFAEEDYCLLLSVYNSGTPVEEKDMVHLFDSFYRGSNTNGKQGNGLGLYICSEIMKKMNGDIFAKRHPDGMEITLVCPLC